MNDKCRIQRVVLMNWKGMFFQPFDLDPGMTILEGANGTGKTTIMIAVYVCLLPDLNFLNFQNVTTVGTRKNEDKGLWGRLGDEGRAFSILDVVTARGDRHLVGVQLTKMTYPQVTLKHFAIKNLHPEAEIKNFLTTYLPESNQQEIPSLEEIGKKCLEYEGELLNFRHAKDYLKFLFDNGISPIRLMENDERRQYNQLLHTSLYGGLSRSLQSSLRDYLLPEDNTLLSSIRDMEHNLIACRRTRASIQRYQSVREIIRSVYETGLQMFSSAFNASRLNAEVSIKKSLVIREEKRQSREEWARLSQEATSVQQELKTFELDYKRVEKDWEEAKQNLDRCRSAVTVAREIAQKQKERQKQQVSEQKARSTESKIREKVEQAGLLNQKLTDRQLELARQLSDNGRAWETLSQEVGLYVQAEKILNEVRELLGNDKIEVGEAEERLKKAGESFGQAREAHKKAYQVWKEANLEQEHFTKYLRLLEETGGQQISPQEAGEAAKRECLLFSDLENRLKQAENLPHQLQELDGQISKRREILEWLIEVDLTEIGSAKELEDIWQQTAGEIDELMDNLNETRLSWEAKNREIQSLDLKIPELVEKLRQWEMFQEWKKQLEDGTARTITSTRDLAKTRKFLEEQYQKFSLEKIRLEAKVKEQQTSFNQLMNEGTPVPGIKKLKEEGYGKLLAEKYEDIPPEWSANLECRLGPLANALVVKDIQSAAKDLSTSFDRPDEIWLVAEENLGKLPEAIEVSDSILVRHGEAWRLSRLPQVPVLGKAAREKRMAFLREKIGQISQEVEKNFQNIRGIEKSQSLLYKIMPLENFLQAVSPLEQLQELKKQKPEITAEIKKLASRDTRLSNRLEQLKTREKTIQKCFPFKELLDNADLEAKKSELQAEQQKVEHLKLEYEQKEEKIASLRQGLELLQQPPTANPAELEVKLEECRQLEEHERLCQESLQRLCDNREHFQFAEQVPLLEEKKGLTRHLDLQLEAIQQEQQELKGQSTQLSKELDQAGEVLHGEERGLLTLDGQLQQLEENLLNLGVEGNDKALSRAEENSNKSTGEKEKIEQQLREGQQSRYRLEVETKLALEKKNRAEVKWKKQFSQAKSAMDSWRIFRGQARRESKLERLLANYFSETRQKNVRSDLFWRQESAARATLVKTLERVPNTKLLLEKIRALESEEAEDISQGKTCLFIWQQIQGYLGQVIPVDLQTSDPEKAQEIIAQKLENLEQNLGEQERSLRQHVETIPHHINAQIRQQKSRIRKLNQQLESVRFGFLQTIRINLETQPKLKEFLDILPQQLDIFTEISEENVPVESLMAALYEKVGAGKVQGDMLLDYRHYVRMDIEVKREGNQNFEKVTSTNLSTGESIGVGIAVLIMVLISWEEQSNLIRDPDNNGSLRFLLLDESSRLDQKALYTLTDFCQTMQLQLLIAAPSVERTLRGTTHHLTRGYFNGREEVIVRGRRLLAVDRSDRNQPVTKHIDNDRD